MPMPMQCAPVEQAEDTEYEERVLWDEENYCYINAIAPAAKRQVYAPDTPTISRDVARPQRAL